VASGDECVHGMQMDECAVCAPRRRSAPSNQYDRIGHEKLLVFCPAITDDSLLHFNRQGESYRLRAYVGRLAGRREWMQPDALTATEFLRVYPPEHQIEVASERLAVERSDRWASIITAHNRRLGIGA
jgi:hypothetical protein